MSILNVARLGHPVLRTRAQAVTREALKRPEIQRLIDDLLATIPNYGAVGLTAPQVHHPLRIIAISDSRAQDVALRPLVLVNPEITIVDQEELYEWEGCPSLPGLCGLVPRARAVHVRALDRQGERSELHVTDTTARVIQHALDHLDGVVFVDRMKSYDKLVFSEYAPSTALVL